MSAIARVHGRQVLDSRGNPTVEVDVELEVGALGRAAVPSGASTGAHEAVELRDGGDVVAARGASKAVANVNGEYRERLVGTRRESTTRRSTAALDRARRHAEQGAPRRERHPRRLARARRAAAMALGVPVYRYAGRRRGADAAGADAQRHQRRRARQQLDRRAGVHGRPARLRSFREALGGGDEVFHALKKVHRRAGARRPSATRAASRPTCRRTRRRSRFRRSRRPATTRAASASIALDPASSRVLPRRPYHFEREDERSTAAASARFLGGLGSALSRSCSIEDGTARTTGTAGGSLTERLGDRVQLVGDDLFVTNPERLRAGDSRARCNCDARQGEPDRDAHRDDRGDPAGAPRRVHRNVMSHRSGETEDTTIADLAVGTGYGQIKTGAPARTDRVAKYNQLLRIEEELGDRAVYPRSPSARFPRARWRRTAPASPATRRAHVRRQSRRSHQDRRARSARRRRSTEMLHALVEAGMNVARLNFSHGDARGSRRAGAARPRGAEEVRRPIAIIADLQGPKIRVGDLEGDARRSTTRPRDRAIAGRRSRDGRRAAGKPGGDRASVLRPGTTVLLDDGTSACSSATCAGRARRARSSSAATITAHKGVNLPDVPTPHPVADREGHRRPRVRARARRRLRRALVRALRGRRPRPARADRASSGAQRTRSSRRSRRPRPSTRSTRSSRRPTPSWSRAATSASRSARRRCRSSQKRIIQRALDAREAGHHRDADARVDDSTSPSRRAPRRATSRTPCSTARPR